MSNVNNNAEHNVNEVNNEKGRRSGNGFRFFGNPKLRKSLRILWNNPKLVINAVYSFFVCLRFFRLKFYKFPAIVDFGSKIRKSRKARLEIKGEDCSLEEVYWRTERQLCLYETPEGCILPDTGKSEAWPRSPGYT